MVSFETSTKCFLLFVFWGGLSCLLSSLLRYLVGCCPCLPEALVGPRQVRETATMWAAQQPRIPTMRLLTQNHPLPYLPDLIHAATQRPQPSRLFSQTIKMVLIFALLCKWFHISSSYPTHVKYVILWRLVKMFPTETYSPPKCVFWGFPPLAHRHPHPVHSSFYLAVASHGLPPSSTTFKSIKLENLVCKWYWSVERGAWLRWTGSTSA